MKFECYKGGRSKEECKSENGTEAILAAGKTGVFASCYKVLTNLRLYPIIP
jgi:hypothetical protein